MNWIYKSPRIGKNEKEFMMYKFRTLKNNVHTSFTQKQDYTWCGRFLRKLKIDELPQLLNIIKGDMHIFGYRPEETRHFSFLPGPIRKILRTEKPGIIDISSLHFFDEEGLMQIGDPNETYWMRVRPLKLTLQMFYIQNRCWLLNITIVYIYLKKILWQLIKK